MLLSERTIKLSSRITDRAIQRTVLIKPYQLCLLRMVGQKKKEHASATARLSKQNLIRLASNWMNQLLKDLSEI